MSTTLPELIQRHSAFWKRTDVARPLVLRLTPGKLEAKPYPIKGGQELVDPTPITPQDVDLDRLLKIGQPLPAPTIGDFINAVGPFYPETWLEAVVGCSIWASAFGCVSRPIDLPLEEALRKFSIERALTSEWLSVMEAIYRKAEAVSAGRLAVRQLHMRGVIDILAAYLGEEQLCQAVYDYPQEVAALADQFADLYLAVARRGLDLRSTWHGGYVSTWHIYAPKPLIDYQIDASNLFSPKMYEQHFLSFDKKVLMGFPYSVLHLHACGLHILNTSLLTLDEITTIQICLDTETGFWEKERMLSYCQKIQSHGKSLLICGEMNDDEFQEFITTLSPRGLAIMA